MPGNSQFVLELLTDKAVLPRARAIGLARILCRTDIVLHLARNSGNVRNGQLPMHMKAVAEGAEGALRRARHQPRVERARRRHEATGVSREQMMFVWLAFTDAYMSAALLAGYKPSERDVWAYMAAAQDFGKAFGLGEVPTSLSSVETRLQRAMSRIQPAGVAPQGWSNLTQVVRSDWFASQSAISTDEVVAALGRKIPGPLVEALRR